MNPWNRIGALIAKEFRHLGRDRRTLAVVLALPFTYKLGITPAVVLLTAMYITGTYGGAFTAILFKVPGEPLDTSQAVPLVVGVILTWIVGDVLIYRAQRNARANQERTTA